MTALPARVREYLDRLLAARLAPFTLCVGHDGKLLEQWGDAGTAGLDDLKTGEQLIDALPWLHGLDLGREQLFPDVTLAEGRTFDIHLLPDGDRAYIVFLAALPTIDARRTLQQTANEVRLLNHRQQRLVQQLEAANREIEARRREAERANAVQSRFIAGMSHEFRTPLTSVLGYADLILDQVREDEELTAYAASVGRAARHLLSMVDNVLDRARLDDDKVVLNMSPVDVRQVTDDLAAMVAPLAADKLLSFGAYVATSVPERVLTDAVRLRQVLLNLVGNAIKFTDSGEIGLDIDWADGTLRLKVSDTGPGIAEEEKERIFEAFRRGAGSAGTRGAGLGLNITRRLLTLLGGSISVASRLGEGSVFSVAIPAAPAAVREAAEPAATPQAVRRSEASAHILLAEDDADIVDLMQIILGRAGFRLTLARDGQQAVERSLRERPDLVLMDVNMPVLDGLSAARTLRQRGFRAPVLALTASLSARDRGKAIDAGCNGYLIKPIAAHELLAAIEQHLETA